MTSLGKNPPPRIVKITYKGKRFRRVATCIAKIPYSGLYELNEVLARMLATNEVEWYRVDIAKPKEIEAGRADLKRWLPALEATTMITGVDWKA
jgi:hypothetical protein